MRARPWACTNAAQPRPLCCASGWRQRAAAPSSRPAVKLERQMSRVLSQLPASALLGHRLRGRFLAGLLGFLATPRAAAAVPFAAPPGTWYGWTWLHSGAKRAAASARGGRAG